jgi:hypothetical protein
VRRLFRAIDARLILALILLLVAGTICWGFVQRGRHITEAEKSVTELSSQVAALLDKNERLNRQLAQGERAATRRSERAARERDALQRELLRLINFLRESGIDAPLTSSRSFVPPGGGESTATVSQPQPQPSGPSQPPGQSGPGSPGGGTQPNHPGHNGGGNPPPDGDGVDVDAGPIHVHVPLPALP